MTTIGPQTFSLFLGSTRTREELDADYAPSRFVSSMADVAADWARRSAAARDDAGARLEADLSYGAEARCRIDYFSSGVRGAPLHVFIHGGFWKSISKNESSFIAPLWLADGVDVAVLDYTLAPHATLPRIVAEVRAGLNWLGAQAKELGFDPGRAVISGHSAGGHLAAMSQVAPAALDVAGLVLVSGVFELEPIRQCYVNDTVAMTEADARELSPMRHRPQTPLPLVVTVGEREPVAFQEQSRAFAAAWSQGGCSVDYLLVPRRDHFSMLDDLADPQSPLGAATKRLLRA